MQLVDDDIVEILLVQQHRNLVDVVGLERRYHGALLDVGEQRDLAALLIGQRLQAAAQQDIRLDADAAQLLHGMLRRLGLDLPRTADDRHQGEVHVEDVIAPEFNAHLANRFEEGQGFDVADGTADLDHANIRITGAESNAVLDLIRDVRNDLHGRAQVVAAALLGDDALVNAAGGEITVASGGGADEALVMPKIEVGLGAIRGDEDFAVLKRTHGPGIHVDVRIQLHHAHLEAARLQDRTQRRGGDPFPER